MALSSEDRTAAMAFHTTHWSVVMAARGQEESTAAREALASLCSSYWNPLYSFIRRQGYNPQEAEDLTQGFFCNILERNSLKNVAQPAGKFRSFLLTCLKHFLINEREKAHAQRRGGGHAIIPLEIDLAETHYALEPADNVTPEALYEKRWALTVLEHTTNALEREYAAQNKKDVFAELKGFLPGGQGGESRADFAARRGISAGAVDVAIHRLRQRFGALLRQEVAQTVSSEAEMDEEIRYLISIVAN
jgi:RNA polymerase sigma-70 factor (ECF subfamily)